MDISPIYIPEFQFGSKKIVPSKVLKLTPYVGIKNNLIIEYEPWALCISSKDRISLIEDLSKSIIFLWKEFVEKNDSKLENHALKVKYRLMEDFSTLESSYPIIN